MSMFLLAWASDKLLLALKAFLMPHVPDSLALAAELLYRSMLLHRLYESQPSPPGPATVQELPSAPPRLFPFYRPLEWPLKSEDDRGGHPLMPFCVAHQYYLFSVCDSPSLH